MNQLTSLWDTLDTRRRVIVVAATLAMFAAVLLMARMAAAPGMSLLYAGLESDAAGEVVQALEQRGVAHEVRGSSIYVDSSRRDTLRMTLASEGMPATGAAGYELLDSLSGFGTTSQMFDAAYWRAKEGELARTITASPRFRSARVHIGKADNGPFRREIAPTASVTVSTRDGGVDAERAKALKYLVAAAVAGLSPTDVSIIDGSGRLVAGPDEGPAAGVEAESDRALALKRNVERLLEARVGPGNAVVEVSVETERDRESITEHRVDPESRVAISSDTEETTSSSSDSREDVTVASNVPDGDAAKEGKSSSKNSESRERINYEISETEREVVRGPGAVERLSVAVLVDGTRDVAEDGEVSWAPRPQPELDALRALVESAVGFKEERGDVITIKSMQFEPVDQGGTVAKASFFDMGGLNMLSLAQLAVLAIVALALGLFVVRPMLTRPSGAAALPAPDGGDRAGTLSGELAASDEGPAGPGGEGIESTRSSEAGPSVPGSLPAPISQGEAVARLRTMIEEREEETVEILRTWMEDREQEA